MTKCDNCDVEITGGKIHTPDKERMEKWKIQGCIVTDPGNKNYRGFTTKRKLALVPKEKTEE